MPPGLSTAPSKSSYYPPNDVSTHRDLLFFEERLKTNAAILNSRKYRYQLFLAQLMLIIVFLLSEVLLQTNLLAIPYKFVLNKALPDIYTQDTPVQVHPYFASGLLFVSVTTLVLFFASGMYSEKIGYANRYVPHANRALRSLNMFLNVRQPPLRSKIPFNPFLFLFPRTAPSTPSSSSPSRRRSPSPAPSKRSSSVPIAPIPPASSPRGELIFSSRVDRSFRESYERFRASFERKREAYERAAFARTWLGWVYVKMPWVKPIPSPAPGMTRPGSAMARGRGSTGATPESSRRSSPMPGRGGSRRAIGGSGLRESKTPPPAAHPLASETT